jgi:hypothetical protein
MAKREFALQRGIFEKEREAESGGFAGLTRMDASAARRPAATAPQRNYSPCAATRCSKARSSPKTSARVPSLSASSLKMRWPTVARRTARSKPTSFAFGSTNCSLCSEPDRPIRSAKTRSSPGSWNRLRIGMWLQRHGIAGRQLSHSCFGSSWITKRLSGIPPPEFGARPK